jgi:hypothetical protein
MIQNHAIYNINTGNIVSSIQIEVERHPNDVQSNVQFDPDLDFIVIPNNFNVSNYYVVTGILTPLPLFTDDSSWNQTEILSNGNDTATFGSNLPNPTYANVVSVGDNPINYVEQEITDGSISITSSEPGDILISLSSTGYADYEITIEASKTINVNTFGVSITTQAIQTYPDDVVINTHYYVTQFNDVTILET